MRAKEDRDGFIWLDDREGGERGKGGRIKKKEKPGLTHLAREEDED